jgi:hypothetical protein
MLEPFLAFSKFIESLLFDKMIILQQYIFDLMRHFFRQMAYI